MKQYLLAAAFGMSVIGAAAATPLTLTATVGGSATGSNLEFLTFDLPGLPPGLTLTLNNAQIVTGSVANLYAAPYFSNNDGALFGETPANGPDATPYVSVEGGGTATLTFAAPQNYLGLLWGSVDTYNALSFYDQQGVLIAVIDGGDVTASANGNQGSNGTYYVNVVSDEAFTKVVVNSGNNAFEFDDVAYDPPPPTVPEPGSLALFGTALLVMGGLIWRRRKSV